MPTRSARTKLCYVPEVDDALPPNRPAALITIPADAFGSKDALRAYLRGDRYTQVTPSQPTAPSTLGSALSASLVAAAGSDGAQLKAKKRSRAEARLEEEVEASPVPTYKPLRPVRSTRLGRPIKTYTKFHHN